MEEEIIMEIDKITKDEALNTACNMLTKLYQSDNADIDAIELNAFVLCAQADKDYGKMYHALEELRKFVVKFQLTLKLK